MVPYFKTDKGILYYGDASEISKHVKPDSVNCVVTSPPYWGKVDYLEGDTDQLGLEKTPKFYTEHIVDIFKEIKKILHPTGVVWLNIGDTNCVPSTKRETVLGMKPGVAAKNRIGIPWKVAFALQDDGWWLRGDYIWYRPNSPREPVKDRPTYEHEYVFLLTKRANYYYDQVAVFQPLKAGDHYAGNRDKIIIETGGMSHGGHNRKNKLMGRNLGSVWTIPTQGRTDSHYAAFPDKLVTRCISAGTSFKGRCSICHTPIKRIVKAKDEDSVPETVGWEPDCKCNASIEPCVVYDPFMGRGTTALVAESLNKNWIGSEMSDEFCELIKKNLLSRKYGLEPTTEPKKGFFKLTEDDIAIKG